MPDLTHTLPFSPEQIAQLREFERLLQRENAQINLVSRKSTDTLFERHILHSLAIAKRSVPQSSIVVDWGTGGGLPAIPLAIAWPHAQIIAVDSIEKKTKAVARMRDELGLLNCMVWRGRAEDYEGKIDYSVSRATAPLSELWKWHKRGKPGNAAGIPLSGTMWKTGLICLKGGDLTGEIALLKKSDKAAQIESIPLEEVFDRELISDHFAGKVIVSVVRPGT